MLDRATDQESIRSWADRNFIDLGEDEDAGVVGYWCRVAGVSMADEIMRRNYTDEDADAAREGWREADAEIEDERKNAHAK